MRGAPGRVALSRSRRWGRRRLQGPRLRGARLQGPRLRGPRLRGPRLRGARLRGARLRGAHLRGARLRGAHLRGARLRGAHSRWRRDRFLFWSWVGEREIFQQTVDDFYREMIRKVARGVIERTLEERLRKMGLCLDGFQWRQPGWADLDPEVDPAEEVDDGPRGVNCPRCGALMEVTDGACGECSDR